MSRIFLSHSSKDDFAAVAVCDWLNENGWDDVFLDLDPAAGIHPGERWERALYEHAARCEAVLFLVSRDWLSSDWCRREYELARKLNKRIFIVLIDRLAIEDLPSYLTQTHQAVSLVAGEDHQVRRVTRPGTHAEGHVTFSAEGLARLKAGLAQAGLDPRFFAWPPASEPDRAPYRGLEPLEAVDAGIFFGRDAPVIEALDALRGLREGACPRLFVVLGASGAGKSSFLRAGLLPRLARDDRSFLPLAPIRPGRAPMTGANGFVAVLAAACAEKGLTVTRKQLREAAAQGAGALRPHLQALAARAAAVSSAPRPPTLVISVDQAEELFRAEGAQEGEHLLALLRELALSDDPTVIALFVIRSDSYDALEHAKPLEGLGQRASPLLPMPRGAYQTVIEGPARRLEQAGRKFEIDPSLTQALLADLEKGAGSDALPLLAFTLEQLFSDHRAAGRLSRADYEKFGGLKGAIDAAIARVFAAADNDPRIPKDHEARLALLRRGLIPWLAGIDPETRTPRRRRAAAAQIPEEARPLTDLLVEQRLLTRAVDEATHETTLEPAHESLLRQWGSLKGWLDEDFSRLVTLEGLKRAARDWDANARDRAWAAHVGARLEEAARLDARPDLAALLDATDRAYLAACNDKQSEALAAERALAAAERRAAQRTRIGLAASSALAVLAIVAAVQAFRQVEIAGELADLARRRGEIAEQRKQEAERQALKAEQEAQKAERERSRAEQETVKAEQERSRAEQERLKAEQERLKAEQQALRAEQRSAVLAARVSQSFTAEGALDQALLLMLDAARVFDDASVPDEIRIAFTKALQKRERVETRTLFPDIQAFETDDALLLLDPATNDIWKLTDALDPQRLVAGSPSDRKILIFRQSANGKEYIALRENLDVERIDAASGARRKVGTISAPRTPSGRSYQLDDTRMTDDGLIVRSFSTTDTGDTANYFQAFDAETGRMIEGELADNVAIKRKRPGGGLYAWDNGKGQALEVVTAGNRLVVRPARLGEDDRLRLQFGDCVARMPNPVKQAVVKELKKSMNPGAEFGCQAIGVDSLITLTNNTSAGPSRSDTLFLSNGQRIDVRNALERAAGGLARNNFAWAGGLAGTEPPASELKAKRLAVLLNRNAYVLSTGGDAESWLLLLDYRHPTFVQHARFAGSDRLVVIDAESGRLVAHDLGDAPKSKIFTTPIDNIIGTDRPVRTLHRGTCVGFSIPRAKQVSMPDGREVVLDTGSATEIRVTGARETTIALGNDESCIEFSTDWKRMLIVREATVVVYDFHKVLESGAIAGAEIGTLPINAGSAFFVGRDGTQVLTSNSSNRVQLWQQEASTGIWASGEIYKGDSPIIYAEPDATGDRMIMIENRGEGDAHGVLYSVTARAIWYDLGSDYKWLGAAFTDSSEVVVAEHGTWMRVYPLLPLSGFVALADAQLSPECRPPAPKEYRQSPCWPASGR